MKRLKAVALSLMLVSLSVIGVACGPEKTWFEDLNTAGLSTIRVLAPLTQSTIVRLASPESRPSAETPTPSPSREWELESIEVDGSTVLVRLRVYSGIDIDVTLNGTAPDEISLDPPLLDHVFLNVSPGNHTVDIADVVGFTQVVSIEV